MWMIDTTSAGFMSVSGVELQYAVMGKNKSNRHRNDQSPPRCGALGIICRVSAQRS
jgi:hypothetical protein